MNLITSVHPNNSLLTTISDNSLVWQIVSQLYETVNYGTSIFKTFPSRKSLGRYKQVVFRKRPSLFSPAVYVGDLLPL